MATLKQILDSLAKMPDDLKTIDLRGHLEGYDAEELSCMLATAFVIIQVMGELDEALYPQANIARGMALALDDVAAGEYQPSEVLQLLYTVVVDTLKKNNGYIQIPYRDENVGSQFTVALCGDNVEAKMVSKIDEYKGMVC